MRVIRHYRIHTGTFAWLLHRLSGLGLIFYLLLHIWVIGHLAGGKESFDSIMEFFNNSLFKFLEIGLIGVIFYHLFNGIRITLIDMGFLVEKQKALYVISVVLWLISWFAVSAVMYARFFGPAAH